MKHDAIEAQVAHSLLLLADSMDEDRYPDADLVRSAAHRIEVLTASERLYKERAERAEAGWAELERLLHANEVAFDADTNVAVDELNQWRERALTAAEDADRLAEAIKAHGPYMDEHCHTALRQHDEAMAQWFCPEHGGPIDDCEQCIDERETADDQVLDEDWPKIVEFDD